MQVDQRGRRRQRVGNHLDGEPHADARRPPATAPRRCGPATARLLSAAAAVGRRARRSAPPAPCRARAPRARARLRFLDRLLAPRLVGGRQRIRCRPTCRSRTSAAIGAWSECKRQARIVEPLGQRERGAAVVVVEVSRGRRRPRRRRSHARRSRPGGRDRGARSGRGAWRCQTRLVVPGQPTAVAKRLCGAGSASLSLQPLVEQASQAIEARVLREIGLHVAERARNVLDVDRVAARRWSCSRTCRAP